MPSAKINWQQIEISVPSAQEEWTGIVDGKLIFTLVLCKKWVLQTPLSFISSDFFYEAQELAEKWLELNGTNKSYADLLSTPAKFGNINPKFRRSTQ